MTTLPASHAAVTHAPERADPGQLLRRVLTLNAPVSIVWGLGVAVGAGALVAPLGTPVVPTVVAGVVATVAGGLFWLFRSRDVLRVREGWLAVAGDLAFGLTLMVAAVAAPELTTAGRWLVGASGLFVADMGILELIGVRRLPTSD